MKYNRNRLFNVDLCDCNRNIGLDLPILKTKAELHYNLAFAHHLGMNYYVNFLERLGKQWISANIKVWHPWQLKQSKSWGPFWSYQLNSTANSAHLAHFRGKWAGLAVLFRW